MHSPDQHFDSYVDFYEFQYSSTIQRVMPLRLASLLEVQQTAGDWSDQPVPDLVISRVAEGQRTFSVDIGAGRFGGPTQKNAALIIAPNTPTSIQMAGQHRLQIVALPYSRLKAVMGDDLRLPDDGDFGALHTCPLANPLIGQMIEGMFAVSDPQDPAAHLFLESTLMSIAALLVMETGKSAPKPLKRGGLAPWQVRRATEMMAGGDGPNVSLTELATSVGLSTFHFCRAFKQATGVAPHRHQTLIRLARAQALLADTRLSIIEVALSVGYDTPQGLTRLFQRELGVSPSQYRRERTRYLV